MAEFESDGPAESSFRPNVQKSVLVCVGERKRPVTFASNGTTEERESLLAAIKEAYKDVATNLEGDLVVQLKSELWEGQFVDLGEDDIIPDRAVVRVVVEPPSATPAIKAGSVAKRLARPSEGEAQALGKLFPSSTSGKRQSRPFDPTNDCCASSAQKKKKAANAQGRPTNMQVVMLHGFSPSIPRGKRRSNLKKDGRIQTLLFKRSMTPLQVKNKIIQGFRHFDDIDAWTYLESSENHLAAAKKQELDGEGVISRKGCLYLCQKPKKEEDLCSSDDDLPIVHVKATDQSSKRNPITVGDSSDEEIQNLHSGHGGQGINQWSQPTTSQQSQMSATQPFQSSTTHQSQPSSSWSELRRQQDEEFNDTLRVDREKASQEYKEHRRKEKLETLRMHLREKYSQKQELQGSDCIKIAFRLPDSSKLEHSFIPTEPTQVLYEFVFSSREKDEPFSIFQCYPRMCVPCSCQQTIGDAKLHGLLTVEDHETQGSVDPLMLLEEAAEDPEEKKDASDFDVLKKAETKRVAFMESLSLKHGMTHTVNRSNIYQDVIDLYTTRQNEILEEFPFRTKFVGEKAIDVGGVTRDLFSAFYEAAYIKLFDGASLLTPVDFPNLDVPPLPTLGTIISHAYMITGILPVKVAFPTLAAMILPNAGSLPDQILIESFIDSLSCLDANVFRDAMTAVKADAKSFSTNTRSALITVLSRFGVREFPNPDRFVKLMAGVAVYHFLRKPASAIAEIHLGIPEQHIPFWSRMNSGDLYSIYKALQASPSKVLAMVEDDAETSNPNQERVLGYLQQFIGNMQADEVSSFLRFVTGSAVCSAKTIRITFNSLEGLARRPIGHTCSNTLELPSSYLSYLEFVAEFKAILSDEEFAWKMDAI